jgi:hypothetical protein
VLNDLYEFRNIIAHGQEITETPYRQKSDLISTSVEALGGALRRRLVTCPAKFWKFLRRRRFLCEPSFLASFTPL